MKAIIAPFIVLLLGLPAPSYSQICSSLDDMAWLEGDWTSEDDTQVVTEKWQRTNNLSYEAQKITVTKLDAKIKREWLSLLALKTQIFYLAKIDEDKLPAPFLLTRCSAGVLVFQNPEYDFPKQIIYQKLGEQQFRVTASDGRGKSVSLNFQKK